MTDAPRAGRGLTPGTPFPKWILLAFPAIIIAGIALALSTSSMPDSFGPRRGDPDTLPETRIALPKTPDLLETPYLKRAIEAHEGVSAREIAISDLADRYHITGTMARSIYEAAEGEGIDPELGFRIIRVESVFDPKAVGRGGGLGLCQLMLGTARDIDPKVRTVSQVMEPRTNMRLGFRNLRTMIEMFGDVRLGVIAYNRGEIAVQRALKRGRDPENGYGQRVLGPRAHGGKAYAGKGLLAKK
ncbi:MAG TPA: transglycosylase SLT domain-containing protein [Longimicrobiaceae bacterium]|nr:transglycosylase SLT domain-containing protein [Longimicrobiaceae bacterium]